MTDPAPSHGLDDLRERLDQLDETPLGDRAELFEDAHAALVRELELLEEASS